MQLGSAIVGGNTTASTGGTYLGVNLPAAGAGSTADFLNLQANGVNKFLLTSAGVATIAGGLTVTAGGASISGAATINTTGTANTTIGNATGTFGLTSSTLNVIAGAISGATTIAANNKLTLSGTGATQLAVTGAAQAATGTSLIQFGPAISGGSANGTYLGLNTSVATTADLLNFQNNGTQELKVTSAGVATIAGGLTVSAGGANITGGIANNAGGITATGSIAGATTIAANSTLTLSGTGANELAVTGAPAAVATSSLVQIGAVAITGGAATGTYLGLNTSGATTADLVNLQNNGVSKLSVTSAGTLNAIAYNVGGTAGLTKNCTASPTAVTFIAGITTAATCTVSDQRLKTNVTSLDDNVLDKLKDVNAVSYNFDCTKDFFTTYQNGCNTDRQSGVLAQQLAQVFPELVHQYGADNGNYYYVDYQGLAVYNLKAVSQLSKFIDSAGNAKLNDVSAIDLSAGIVMTDVVATHYTQAEAVAPGDVVALDASGNLRQATTPFQKGLIGVVVADKSGSSQVAVATAGKAVVKVTGTVTVGDLLTSSSVAGVAQVASGSGPIIGVATTSFSGSGQGTVIMAVQNSQTGQGGSTDPALQNQVNALSSSVDQIKAGLTGADGQPVNFKNLQLGALHISLDTIADGGLTVGGAAEFKGTALFDQLVTFGAPVDFNQEVHFNGNANFNNNTGGYAVINAGRTSVHVVFSKPYAQAPIVSLTKGDTTISTYHYENVTTTGFDIVLDQVNGQDVHLSWLALSVIGANTFVQQ